MTLMAQAVPSATRLPCVADLPIGWGVGSAETIQGKAVFVVGVNGGVDSPVTVTLLETCPARVDGTDQIKVSGGCVTYRASVEDTGVPSFTTNGGLWFTPRSDLIEAVALEDDQVLCGAGVPPCP